jgi:hypothetical protein
MVFKRRGEAARKVGMAVAKSFVFSAFVLILMVWVLAFLVGEFITEIRSSFKLRRREGRR